MKQGIHPDYAVVPVHCACGETWTTKSTKGQELRLEICSKCHPFYTGKQRLLDTAGRVDRFTKKFGSKEDLESKRTKEAEVAAAAKKSAAEREEKAAVKAREAKAKEKEQKAREREARAAQRAKEAKEKPAPAPAAAPDAAAEGTPEPTA